MKLESLYDGHGPIMTFCCHFNTMLLMRQRQRQQLIEEWLETPNYLSKKTQKTKISVTHESNVGKKISTHVGMIKKGLFKI